MIFRSDKQLSIKVLIIYMISSLLFLSSIDLHIHTDKAAASADHGFSVAISQLSSGLIDASAIDEIGVSPDGMLKVNHSAPNVLAVFILLALIIVLFCQVYISRIRNTHATPELPFYGTPTLRAPPQ